MPARYTTPYAMKAGRPKSSAIQLEATRRRSCRARDGEEHGLERAVAVDRVAARGGAQLREAAERDQAPAIEDADPVAERLGHVETVGREEDRDAARRQLDEQAAQRDRTLRI